MCVRKANGRNVQKTFERLSFKRFFKSSFVQQRFRVLFRVSAFVLGFFRIPAFYSRFRGLGFRGLGFLVFVLPSPRIAARRPEIVNREFKHLLLLLAIAAHSSKDCAARLPQEQRHCAPVGAACEMEDVDHRRSIARIMAGGAHHRRGATCSAAAHRLGSRGHT